MEIKVYCFQICDSSVVFRAGYRIPWILLAWLQVSDSTASERTDFDKVTFILSISIQRFCPLFLVFSWVASNLVFMGIDVCLSIVSVES